MNGFKKLALRWIYQDIDRAVARLYEDRKINSKALHEVTAWTYKTSGAKPGRWTERYLGGHFTVGPLTVFGDNAMHWAWQLRTPNGYVVARPPSARSHRNPCVYFSPDATPSNALWGFGVAPGKKPKNMTLSDLVDFLR